MFKPGYIYTHDRMLDAAIYILKSYSLQDGRYILKIRWVLKRGLDLNVTETVKIKRETLKYWREYVNPGI